MKSYQIEKVQVNKFQMTPGKAKELLELNTRNRKASDAAISLYARDMKSETFNLSGSTICVSDTGVLLDGQQRLMACIRANKPFWTILVEGLPEEAMLTIDSGKKRTYADRLKINGHENATNLAATVKMLGLIANKNPKDTGYSVSELDAILDKHPRVSESVSFCKKTFYKSDNLLSGIHYIATKTGYQEQADEFIKTWKDGQINYDHDPVVYVRNRLIQDQTRLKKMTTVSRMRLIMLSWHKFKTYSELKSAKLGSQDFFMDRWDRSECGL